MKHKNDEINDLLVDYLENDLSNGLKKDLKLVIENSPDRDKSLRAFEETRRLVQSSEPKMPQLSDAFFDRLHDKIMADVSKQKPHQPVRLWLETRSWQTYAAAAAIVLVSGAAVLSLLNPRVSLQSAGVQQDGDMLLSISVEVPEAFADSLLNDRDSEDFFKEAMAERVAQVGESQASSIMNEIGEE